ncbi:hypothetical protein EG68_09643 [Paragonimus skrjabini miyazakii]|uniref:Delta(3,5)-Delta(2,4)-dienoyl-CoA isomerase, mitochondrial n=1 Tax=Paragonimus skrjabini miyazakii TaxID=59628 RepID=A0A8S9YMT9_9TREM|nr:hypothetical protein EG68_09643 [Paragonimus skrjabini miyazakii]
MIPALRQCVRNLPWAPTSQGFCVRHLHAQSWETYAIDRPTKNVVHLQFNRAEKLNAMSVKFWKETKEIFKAIQVDKSIRSVVVSGRGKAFSSGLDFAGLWTVLQEIHSKDAARFALSLRRTIQEFQESFTWLERCNKPVIAAIHGACIGGAVNMICAADIRYCTEDAWFQVKVALRQCVRNLPWAPTSQGFCVRHLHAQSWETYAIDRPTKNVVHLQFNRAEKLNAMSVKFWKETKEIFKAIQVDKSIRSVVVSGRGKAFSSGLDFAGLWTVLQEIHSKDAARFALSLRRTIQEFQESFTWLERCNKPVIAAIHGACIGGAVNMICAADIRYCTEDAWFQVKEMELSIAADVGILQRMPRIIGNDSLLRELIYTARRFDATEALGCGLVSRVLKSQEDVINEALQTAEKIAVHSPVAMQTAKYSLLYARDHGVTQGLAQMADWNQVMLQSADVMHAVQAAIKKQKPQFEDA